MNKLVRTVDANTGKETFLLYEEDGKIYVEGDLEVGAEFFIKTLILPRANHSLAQQGMNSEAMQGLRNQVADLKKELDNAEFGREYWYLLHGKLQRSRKKEMAEVKQELQKEKRRNRDLRKRLGISFRKRLTQAVFLDNLNI